MQNAFSQKSKLNDVAYSLEVWSSAVLIQCVNIVLELDLDTELL